ncbi:MAG TPA: phage tail protein [Verrucomicrobiae bacterium]|nr:phage tail protein [Verrucomicrobiae bacterium]HTZ56037.1 phage tail protein [Candidatus Acidoferrum sp.]
MSTGQRVDPFRNFNFLVEIDGITQASFIECSGLESTTEVIETRSGGDALRVYKLPGKTSYADITLKWGTTSTLDMMNWRQDTMNGIINRQNGSVVLYDLTNQVEVARWDFYNAWPTKWDGPSLNAKGTDIAIDTMVLACEWITRSF